MRVGISGSGARLVGGETNSNGVPVAYVEIQAIDTASGLPVPLACVTDSNGRGYLLVTTSSP